MGIRNNFIFGGESVLKIFLTGFFVLVRKKNILDRESRRVFECGFSTIEERRIPFSLRFFLVAIVFLIFDVEILLLFPVLIGISFYGSLIILFICLNFLLILSVGLFYE